MIDFDNVFSDELVDYTREIRAAGSTDAEGVWVPGVITQSVFKATELQPLSMNELKSIADGEKVFSYVKIYSSFNVNTRTNTMDADNIIHSSGDKYKVVQSENRTSHFKIYLRLT